MLKERIYFIAAIGTDAGKTFLVEKICQKLRAEKIKVNAIKPVVSGFNADGTSDCEKILAALSLPFSKENIDAISPWRFEKPVSPNFAAALENKKIDFSEVKKFCEEKISAVKKSGEFLFIESAGGVASPVTDEKTFLDLAAELKIPVLLLSANYLGSISHTICAFEVLKARKISLEKIIINEHFLGHEKPSGVSMENLSKLLANLTKTEVVSLENFLD
jgi:dethiobiotin synthetase